ncbi:MAG: Fe(3+) ABC transporter substrate-binding protein [Hyphomicrobiaceae bacterium]
MTTPPRSRRPLRALLLRKLGPALAGLALAAGLAPTIPAAAAEINVYSYREPSLIEPLIDAFRKQTGIDITVVYAKDGLIERIAAEDRLSPADVLLTNEFGLLIEAKRAGITQPVESEALWADIPAGLRDPENHWFGLTRRARIVYASKARVAEEAITYEDLADPKWKGRICVRSGQHTYNIALIASMIAHHGREATKTWLTAVRDNLARRPAGGDRDQVKAIYAGECDIALGNTYYMGAMLTNTKEPEQKVWADSVKLLFPNADERGTHVNISGAALLKFAPHRDEAIRLLEFLASPEAQSIYASVNNEYPIDDANPPSEPVASWGTLKPDPLPLAEIADHRKEASELVDEVGFDEGPGS